MGYKEWFVDCGTISPGSVNNAFEGNHYYRCMRLLKEAFDALVQFRTENITGLAGCFEKCTSQSIPGIS